MHRNIWLLLSFIYCAVIYLLSDQPMLPVPDLFSMQDKLIHALAYGLMAWLLWQAGFGRVRSDFLFIVVVLFCSFYGFTDEWHQSFVEGRVADVYDWLADTLGALLLTSICYKGERVISKGG